jgi:prepilin-type N-terminal cleavage/methylation domain-containing protein
LRYYQRKEYITMKRSAFTLIELLVVIAVIAVLMSILLPALRLAMDNSRRIYCLSNVRSLAAAWFMYAGDNDDKLVNGNVPAGSNFKSPTERFWVEPPQDSSGKYTGANPTLEDELRGIRAGGLYSYVKDVDAYRCPADRRKKDPSKATFRSYSIPGGMNGEAVSGGYNVKPVTQYSEIKNPVTKYVFVEEADPRKWNMGSWLVYPTGNQWIDPLSAWHKDRSALGWADGHAEMHKWLDKRTIEMSEKGEQMATHTNPENPDLKFMQKGYQVK